MRSRVCSGGSIAKNDITVGDPIVVVGRLYTRDWTDNEKNQRVSYEMEAVAVGHDLARGRTRLYRNKPTSISGAAEGSDGNDGLA